MDILYLSSLCSVREYERMFRKFASTSSHASQKFNRLMVSGLTSNGCHVDTLTQRMPIAVDQEEKRRPEELEKEIHYQYLPCYQNKLINRMMTVFNAAGGILKWHRKHRQGFIICDIVLGELSLAVWLVSRFSHLKKTALVTDVPSIRAGEKRRGIRAIPFRIKNATIQNYDSYIFLTQQMNTVLNQRQRPYVVIEGIVDSHVQDNPNRLEEKYEKKTCMMAGLLEDIFGADDLTEAFTQIQNPDARLVFYGKGSSTEKILEAAKEDPRISYLGELTNAQIVSEEKKATLLINPRPPEGEWTAYSFPSKNMEYIASGTPMLAYRLPCIPEEYIPYSFYISDTENRVDRLKESLREILDKDAEELHRKGLEAQAWIIRNKNAEVQTKKVVEMLAQTTQVTL